MSKPSLTTSKMPKETEQQYTAWLLYCESGSLDKLHRMWDGLHRGFTDASPEMAGVKERLGAPPTRRTLADWSKKYRWVERKDLKLVEDLEGIRKKSQEIKQKKVGVIAEIFWDKLQALRRQIKKGEGATTDEIKKLWEMFRTEMGETLGKHEIAINEDEQKPLTPEEDELGRELDQTIKSFYERKRKARKN